MGLARRAWRAALTGCEGQGNGKILNSKSAWHGHVLVLPVRNFHKNHSGFKRIFITPGCCAYWIAAGALLSGNVWVMRGRGSTFLERSKTMAFAKGPHRDPTSVISFTTSGPVSTGN